MIRKILEAIRKGRPLSYKELSTILRSEGWFQIGSKQSFDLEDSWIGRWAHKNEDLFGLVVFWDQQHGRRGKVREVALQDMSSDSEHYLPGMYPGPEITSIKDKEITERAVRDLVRIQKKSGGDE